VKHRQPGISWVITPQIGAAVVKRAALGGTREISEAAPERQFDQRVCGKGVAGRIIHLAGFAVHQLTTPVLQVVFEPVTRRSARAPHPGPWEIMNGDGGGIRSVALLLITINVSSSPARFTD
jgi:hypothetical protein